MQRERDRILKEQIAPKGAWIETGRVRGRPPEWKQAYWRAKQPIFESVSGKKTRKRYIGIKDGPEHQAALEAVSRRKRLRELDQSREKKLNRARKIGSKPQ